MLCRDTVVVLLTPPAASPFGTLPCSPSDLLRLQRHDTELNVRWENTRAMRIAPVFVMLAFGDRLEQAWCIVNTNPARCSREESFVWKVHNRLPLPFNNALHAMLFFVLVFAKVNLAFQFYDLVATVFIGRLCKVEMIVHHALATVMCYFLMRDW